MNFPFMQHKRIMMIVMLLVVAGIVVIAFLFWLTSPRRTLNAFLDAIEDGKQSAALSYVAENIKPERRDNVELFLDDWTSATDLSIARTTEESWRTRGGTENEEDGDNTLAPRVEQIPTPKYWAHHYEAQVTLSFDGYEDPVIIKLKRQVENEESLFAQLFRGWKVTRIRYQPISDDDLNVEDFELDTEDLNADGAIEFEVDEDGNIVPSEESDAEEPTTNDAENETNEDAI